MSSVLAGLQNKADAIARRFNCTITVKVNRLGYSLDLQCGSVQQFFSGTEGEIHCFLDGLYIARSIIDEQA
ncbi:MAG TPA: hypothetical protein V6C65_13400 [Allocoleopsis sp.]